MNGESFDSCVPSQSLPGNVDGGEAPNREERLDARHGTQAMAQSPEIAMIAAGPPGGSVPRRRLIRMLGAAAVAPLVGIPGRGSLAASKRHKPKHGKGRNGKGGSTKDERGETNANANANPNATTTLFRDDFIHGFDATGSGNWFYFTAGPFVGDDGVETTSAHGLQVSAPAFTKTVSQVDSVPGGVDHVKWLVYANRFANGVPGFAAEPGRELAVEATVSAQTFGTENHPFEDAVVDPEDDLRLASAALNGIDFESWMVFDIFLTNKQIYAFYERLPFGRGAPLGNYAAFSYQIPIATRTPGAEHKLSTVYDRTAGTVRWLVDGKERFRVNRIGYHLDNQNPPLDLDRQNLTIDHGGDEGLVEPKQLDFGMGMFTLLDGQLPSGKALVRLSAEPGLYFDPVAVPPAAQTFVDPNSQLGSRLFGQGAVLHVERFAVQSRRANDRRH